jgi:hypothetical protein
MQIDPEITKHCAAQAKHYRELETQAGSGPSSAISSPSAPQTPTSRPQLRKILPKTYQETDTASDYSTDTGGEDKYALSSPSPQIAFTNPWSAVNSPTTNLPKIAFTNPWSPASTTGSASPRVGALKLRDAADIPRSHTPLDLLPPPRKPLYPAINTALALSSAEPPRIISAISPKSFSRRMDMDEDYDAGSDGSDDGKGPDHPAASKKTSRGFNETKAAYVLMKLKMQRDPDVKSLKRRASA